MDRGQFELSLNWIYIIIVGVFVIYFFSKIGVFTIKKSEFDNAKEIAEYFNNIITELYSTYNQMGYVNLENIEFKIIEEKGYSRIEYKGKNSLLKGIVFSPESLKGNISYWSYGYKRGILSNKILLLSDSRYKYLFYYTDENDHLKYLLLNELPENYNDYFKIIFTNNINQYSRLKNKKIVCLNLEEEYCNVIIREEDDNYIIKIKDGNFDGDKEYYVYTPNEMFLAVFSKDKNYFEDTMKLLEEKNSIVLDVFLKKVDMLKLEEENGNNNNVCINLYEDIKNDFGSLKKYNLIQENNVLKNSDYEKTIRELKEKNILLFRNNCKTIY